MGKNGEHTIFKFVDKNGITIDFERWSTKAPKHSIWKMAELAVDSPNLFFDKNIQERCTKVITYYTNYETTPDKKTFECSIEKFRELMEINRMFRAERAKIWDEKHIEWDYLPTFKHYVTNWVVLNNELN